MTMGVGGFGSAILRFAKIFGVVAGMDGNDSLALGVA